MQNKKRKEFHFLIAAEYLSDNRRGTANIVITSFNAHPYPTEIIESTRKAIAAHDPKANVSTVFITMVYHSHDEWVSV